MLRSFLPSVVRFSEADGAVVYVADNGSTDASVDMLCREFLTVRLILLEENQGFAEKPLPLMDKCSSSALTFSLPLFSSLEDNNAPS